MSTQVVYLPDEDLAALRACVRDNYPSFLGRFDARPEIRELGQPYFGRHRVLELASAMPLPARRLHLALSEWGEVLPLSGRAARFQALCRADPPPPINAAGVALDYALFADFVTTEGELGELTLHRFSDIPFHAELDRTDRIIRESVRDTVGEQIGSPVATESEGGWTVIKWVVSEGALIRRELTVGRDGAFRRANDVLEPELPVPLGRIWGVVDGRVVPVG